MIKYIAALLLDVGQAAKAGDATAVHYASKNVVQEIARIDPQDFAPQVRADFVRLRGILTKWSLDIRGVNVQESWQEIEPGVLNVLQNFKGKSPSQQVSLPPEIQESIARFSTDHPNPAFAAFVMMRFGTTKAHEQIIDAIRLALSRNHILALRADDKQYHDDLFWNVMTYAHGCSFGIAVFERIEEEAFNPNVALEVGYMLALRKPVCLLKDMTLKTLHADLIGKLYREFDPQNPMDSIRTAVEPWLNDKNLLKHPSSTFVGLRVRPGQ